MTQNDRLAAAKALLAEAEQRAAAGEGFLAAERAKAERTNEVASARRRAAGEERRAERAERRARRGGPAPAQSPGTAPAAGASPRDLFAPEREAMQARQRADRRRRGLDPSGPPGQGGPAPDAAAAAADGVVDPEALESGEESRRRRERPVRRSPFAPPPDEPDLEPDPHEVARQIVLRQLAMAPRSRAQLREKLLARECPPDVAETVLDRMEEVGLVDDEAYAQMLVRSQVATRGLARRGLAHELRKKGIDRDLADAALDDVDADDERRTARALVDKKLRTMGGLGVDVQTRRLAGMLARKGYPAGLAYAVIRDAVADSAEHQRD